MCEYIQKSQSMRDEDNENKWSNILKWYMKYKHTKSFKLATLSSRKIINFILPLLLLYF